MDTGGKLAASTTVFVKNILLLPLCGISSVTCHFTSLCYLMISQLRIHLDSATISQGYPLFIPLVKKNRSNQLPEATSQGNFKIRTEWEVEEIRLDK